jgi:ABC-type uncharacterized transport system substrate-binding protein
LDRKPSARDTIFHSESIGREAASLYEKRMKNRIGPSIFLASGLVLLAQPAWPHPHVSVTAKAEVLYAPDGKVTGIRHAWTFDRAYSAFITQGLDKNSDGKLTPDELQELARENTESLVDFEYFTAVKANGAKQAFDAPRDPAMSFVNNEATLTYVLPLKAPAAAPKLLSIEVSDPTFYVAFTLASGEDAVRLAGAPKGCALTISRPKPVEAAQQNLSEAFFQALSSASSYGTQFVNRAIIACP